MPVRKESGSCGRAGAFRQALASSNSHVASAEPATAATPTPAACAARFTCRDRSTAAGSTGAVPILSSPDPHERVVDQQPPWQPVTNCTG